MATPHEVAERWSESERVPSAGIEPAPPASEAGALSSELRGLMMRYLNRSPHPVSIPSGRKWGEQLLPLTRWNAIPVHHSCRWWSRARRLLGSGLAEALAATHLPRHPPLRLPHWRELRRRLLPTSAWAGASLAIEALG